MKKQNLWILLLLGLLVNSINAQDKQNVGLVEFEEKNSIGLENAGVIIPEMLVSHLANIGEYKLTERVLLKKALEEQKLQMTGLVDEETAAEVGKIYGLEGIITGSAMKIGSQIKISGRLIQTETGEILTSGSISFTDIEKLEEKLESLAYQLSGTSKEEYNKLSVNKKMSRSRYGVRLGFGYTYNDSEADPNSGLAVFSPGIYYHSEKIDLEFVGLIPPSDVSLLATTLAYNISPHIGLGVAYSYIYDGMSADNEHIDGATVFTADIHSINIGFNYRATDRLRAGLYLGTVIKSEIDYKRGIDNMWGSYQGDTYFEFPATSYILNFEYYITERLSLMTLFIQNNGSGDIVKKYTEDFPEKKSLQSGAILLQLGYSFSF
jgi:hypothetical protein